jgi:ABC-type methionine transport system ATPase subunit
MTVYDNMASALKLHKVPAEQIRQRVQSVYDRLGRWTGVPAVRELRERLSGSAAP